jgi:outer membrane lipoprotein-sorting protein
LTLRRLPARAALRAVARGLCLAVIAAALAGCAMFASRQIESPTSNELAQPPAPGWTAEKLAAILSRRDQEFKSLRALASVYYRGPEGRQGFQEAVLVQRPDKARLETLSGLGAILVVTVNADQIAGFHPREGVFVRGKSSKENLFRYTRMPLELHEMTRLLLGLPPVTLSADWKIAGSALYRDLNGQRKEVVTFDLTRELPIRWYRLNPDGSAELSAAFDNFTSTAAGLFPAKIILEAAAQQRSLEIAYQDPEVNVELPPSVFIQEKPPNAKEVPIEALGN